MSALPRSMVKTLVSRMKVVPPVRAVAEQLLGQIDSGVLKPGDRLPAIRDLSSQFDLSVRGISQAIEQLELLGMVERIHGSGCYVRTFELPQATSAQADSVYLFGMKDRAIVMQQVIEPLVSAIQRAGLFAVLVDTALPPDQVPSEQELRDAWANRPPRGIISKDAKAATLQLAERAAPSGTRLVTAFQGRTRANRQWHKVEPDEFEAYRMAAQYLVDQGIKSIGLILPENRFNATHLISKNDRDAPIEAIEDVVQRAGGKTRYDIHVNPAPETDPSGRGLGQDNLEKMTSWLKGKDAPQGVIMATWRTECIQLAAAMAGKRIGKDLLLVGVGDDHPAREGRHACVSMGHDRVAQKAVELVLDDDPDLDHVIQHVTLLPELVEAAVVS